MALAARLYFTGAPAPISLVYLLGTWEDSSGVGVLLSPTKQGASAVATHAEATTSTTWDVGLVQGVTAPVAAAGTLQGSYTLTRSRQVSDAAASFISRIVLRVVSGDGSVLRGTADNRSPSTAWTTTETGEQLTFTMGTPVAVQVGDRIVAEIGYRTTGGTTTSYSGSIRYGGTDATDLASGDTGTAVAVRSPWIQFADPAVVRMFTAGADSAPAVDTVARTVRMARTVSESAPAADSVAGHRRAASAVSDSAPAVDTVTYSKQRARRAVDSAPAVDTWTMRRTLHRTAVDVAGAVDYVDGFVIGTGAPAKIANPAWPAVGFEVDFTVGPPGRVGPNRRSINTPLQRLAVRKFAIDRGRQYELDQIQSGTCAWDLPDPLEVLNPDNTASPYNQGGNRVTPYRAMAQWAIWPNQPGSGNLLNPTADPVYDPSFETTTGGFTPVGDGTLAQLSTAQALIGAQSLRVTCADPLDGVSLVLPTVPGLTYTASVYVFATSGTVHLEVVDGAGTVHPGRTVASALNHWTRLYCSWDALDSAEQLVIRGDVHRFIVGPDAIIGPGVTVGATGGAPQFFIDAAMVEFGLRLSAFTPDGPTLYSLFSGYAERYPTTYDMQGTRAQRPLQGVDPLAILSRAAIRQSYDAEVAQDGPAIYMPMNNGQAPTTSTDLGAASTASPNYLIPASSSIQWGGDQQPDGTPAVTVTQQNPSTPPARSGAGNDTEIRPTGGRLSMSTTGATLEFWARPVSGAMELGFLYLAADDDPLQIDTTSVQLGYRIVSTGAFVFIPEVGGTTYSFGTPGPQIDYYPDGDWHYFALTLDGEGALRDHFDGYVGPRHPVAFAPERIGWTILNYLAASTGFGYPQSQFSFARWAVYPGDIGDDRHLAHYQRGVGYKGERSGARIARLLAQYWGGPSQVAPGLLEMAEDTSYDGRTVLDVAQEIQESERGLFYAAADGTVVFEDRESRYNSQQPLWTFGEDPDDDGSEFPYVDYKTDHDPTYTFSQANLTRPGNSGYQPIVDQAAAELYGQRILTQTLQCNTDFDLDQAGIFYSTRYSTPTTRITTLTLKPSTNPALWPVVLSLEISQRVRVKRRSAFTFDAEFYVEKISHRGDAESSEWQVDLQLSPVFVPAAWVLGDSTYSVLGQTTTPIY